MAAAMLRLLKRLHKKRDRQKHNDDAKDREEEAQNHSGEHVHFLATFVFLWMDPLCPGKRLIPLKNVRGERRVESRIGQVSNRGERRAVRPTCLRREQPPQKKELPQSLATAGVWMRK